MGLRLEYGFSTLQRMHAYEVRPRKDHRGVDLISDVLPFGWLWYTKPDDAIGYAMHSSRSHDAVIRVYEKDGNVVERTSTKAISRGGVLGSFTDYSKPFAVRLCSVQAVRSLSVIRRKEL